MIFEQADPPHDKDKWLKVAVHFFCPERNERKIYETTLLCDEDGPGLGIWETGNFSCDCNRFLFMYEEDVKCSDGRIIVEKITPIDEPENILYSDSTRE